MSEIGNRLRETRVRKGLTIRDAESATKIRVKYLEALEQDDFEVLPGPTYAKAFLRTYATYLKLDADEMVEEYRRGHGLRRDETNGLRGEPVPHTRSRSIVEREKRKSRRSQRGFVFVGVLAVIAIGLLAWLVPSWGEQDTATISPGSLTSVATVTSVSAGEGATTSSVSPASTTPVAVTSGGNVTLELTVTEGSCWLVVHEDSEAGAELYAGTLAAGGKKTFEGSRRYWMRVGDPRVLVVSINGSPVPLDTAAGSFVVTEAGAEPEE